MPKKRLYRPREGRKVAGVATGIAKYFDIDVTWVRIIWLLLLIPGGLPGFLPYLIFWLAMPSE